MARERVNSKAIRADMSIEQIERRLDVMRAEREGSPKPSRIRALTQEVFSQRIERKPPYMEVVQAVHAGTQGYLVKYEIVMLSDDWTLTTEDLQRALRTGFSVNSEGGADT